MKIDADGDMIIAAEALTHYLVGSDTFDMTKSIGSLNTRNNSVFYKQNKEKCFFKSLMSLG
ncbi:MAG: hypothetical protein R2771_00820 [Saprospiraceae bacterium]